MADLVESKRLLDRGESEFTGMVVFGIEDPDTGHFTCELHITDADDNDFGSPEQVTVTITPGDKLNG